VVFVALITIIAVYVICLNRFAPLATTEARTDLVRAALRCISWVAGKGKVTE
jgi:hypothetical protein